MFLWFPPDDYLMWLPLSVTSCASVPGAQRGEEDGLRWREGLGVQSLTRQPAPHTRAARAGTPDDQDERAQHQAVAIMLQMLIKGPKMQDHTISNEKKNKRNKTKPNKNIEDKQTLKRCCTNGQLLRTVRCWSGLGGVARSPSSHRHVPWQQHYITALVAMATAVSLRSFGVVAPPAFLDITTVSICVHFRNWSLRKDLAVWHVCRSPGKIVYLCPCVFLFIFPLNLSALFSPCISLLH